MSTELMLTEGHVLPAGQAMVFERDGVVFANSRDVAGFFGKRHDHVLRDIRHLVAEGVPNFGEGSYTLPETGPQKHPCFDITRDGFALLAMGFTGKKALKWMLLYIDAFNKMEAALCARAAPAAIEAGKPVEHFGVELARAFVGLMPEQFIAAIRAATTALHEVCAATGLDPAPFRCGDEVEEHAIREFDRLASVTASGTPTIWRS